MTSLNDDVTLVQLETNDTVYSPLTSGDSASDEFPLGSEPVTVVQDLRELEGNELITESTNIPIESQTLKVDVSGTQDGSTWRLVASTGLNTDESVLDDVDTTDTVLTSESIESKEDFHTIGVSLLLVRDGDLDRETCLELDRDLLGGGGGVLGRDGEFPHVYGRCSVGVFEDTGLVGDVEQVLIG